MDVLVVKPVTSELHPSSQGNCQLAPSLKLPAGWLMLNFVSDLDLEPQHPYQIGKDCLGGGAKPSPGFKKSQSGKHGSFLSVQHLPLLS